jgi:response regulator RpfG family c-di-GMP phosphodiesterase
VGESATQKQPRILLVDDEVNILKSLQRLLRREELDCILASSGKDGIALLRKHGDIGLIVSDQRMPEMTGVEFLEQSRSVAPYAIRFVLTGYADMQATIEAINRGKAHRYFTKPWDEGDLVMAVKDALGTYSLVMENRRLDALIKKQNGKLRKWNTELDRHVKMQTRQIKQKNMELSALNERLERNLDDTIVSLSGLMELRDRSARSHSQNVADMAVEVAGKLGLEDEEIKAVSVASLMHDIGKIGMPDVLLTKGQEHMGPEELKEYARHPVRGQASLGAIEDFKLIGTYIRHHHENYDGSGFPDGIRAEDIPLGARIIAFADFVERLNAKHSSDRKVDRAIGAAKASLGTKLDPALYPFFHKIIVKAHEKSKLYGERREMELSVGELMPGMVTSRAVISGTGLLLLREGIPLSDGNIQTMRRCFSIDPITTGVFVWTGDAAP